MSPHFSPFILSLYRIDTQRVSALAPRSGLVFGRSRLRDRGLQRHRDRAADRERSPRRRARRHLRRARRRRRRELRAALRSAVAAAAADADRAAGRQVGGADDRLRPQARHRGRARAPGAVVQVGKRPTCRRAARRLSAARRRAGASPPARRRRAMPSTPSRSCPAPTRRTVGRSGVAASGRRVDALRRRPPARRRRRWGRRARCADGDACASSWSPISTAIAAATLVVVADGAPLAAWRDAGDGTFALTTMVGAAGTRRRRRR